MFILNNFAKRAQFSKGVVEGFVETPIELTKSQLNDLGKALKSYTGKEIVLMQKTQDDLLAGVVLKIGSIMIDGSLRTKLVKIRQGMKG